MHRQLNSIYECNCPDCSAITSKLAAADDKTPSFKDVLKAGEKAFKKLFDKGSYSPKDITDYSELIDKINAHLQNALELGITEEIPDKMLKRLKEDVFIFSAFKTHAQLYEASRLLLNEDGKMRSYSEFQTEIKAINPTYNSQYLEAEFIYAKAASQSAANWDAITKEGDSYNLQYRTAGDDKVRASHADMDKITLPPSDNFWDLYYPPNGWRCRCVAVQVNKDKYEKSDPEAAMNKGDVSMSEKEAAIFKYNPGKEQVIFPPEHPYTKVKGASKIKENL